MKSFRYKHKPQEIKGFKEVSDGTRRINIPRIIYLFLLSFAILTIAFWLFDRNFFASSFGEVVTEKFEVKFPRDVSIVDYWVKENDWIKKGDTLCIVKPYTRNTDSLKVASLAHYASPDWLERERAITMRNLSSGQIEAARIKKEIEIEKTDRNVLREEVYLDIRPGFELTASKKRLARLESDYKIALRELSHLRRYLSQLNEMDQKHRFLSSLETKITPEQEIYISPIQGKVNQIYSPLHQTLYRQEVAFDMVFPDRMFILAYIDQEVMEYFEESNLVGIKFHSGVKTLGRVANVYHDTAELPDEFRKTYEKRFRTVLARVEPLNESMAKQWKPYYKLSASLYRPKWFVGAWERYKRK